MVCETTRIIQRQREKELERKKKKKKEKAKKKILRTDTRRIITEQAEKNGWTVKRLSDWKLVLTKPFTNDRMEVEILKQRMIKFDIPGIISAVNHANAEAFLREVTHKLGAKVVSIFHKMGAAFGGHQHGHHHH